MIKIVDNLMRKKRWLICLFIQNLRFISFIQIRKHKLTYTELTLKLQKGQVFKLTIEVISISMFVILLLLLLLGPSPPGETDETFVVTEQSLTFRDLSNIDEVVTIEIGRASCRERV